MATLYFSGAVDTDWSTLGNWWTNEACTVAAGSLPATSDSVVALANVTSDNRTVVNIEMLNTVLFGTLTVTGTATISGGLDTAATLNGNATFIASASNSGTVNGNAAFDGGSNYGTVSGNATFTNGAVNAGFGGGVTGDAAFSGGAANDGAVGGNATFTSGSYHNVVVTGNATFTDSYAGHDSSVGGDLTATNGSTTGGGGGCVVGGNVTLYGNHYGMYLVTGTSTLYDTSWMDGHAGGGLAVNDGASAGCGWGGTATFNDGSFNNFSGVSDNFSDAVFNDNSHNNSQTQNATFNDASRNEDYGVVYAFLGAVFNDDSVDIGSNTGAYYNDRSHASNNTNYVGAYFSGRSRATASMLDAYFDADIEISGDPIGSYQAYTDMNAVYSSITFTRAGLGVNGSSILGVV
jgi:hypothetical protein